MKAGAGSAAAGQRPRATAKTPARAAAKSIPAAPKKSAPVRTARSAKAKPVATVTPTRRQDAPVPEAALPKPPAKTAAEPATPRVVPPVTENEGKQAAAKPAETAVAMKAANAQPKSAPAKAPATKSASPKPAPSAKPTATEPVAPSSADTVANLPIGAPNPEPEPAAEPDAPDAPLSELDIVTAEPAMAVAEVQAQAPAPPRHATSMNRAAPPPRPPAKPEVFAEGDHVVYPTHGVGKVERIAVEEIAGHKLELIHITFEENRMTLRVPVSKARSAGLRKLATRKLFEEALNVLKGRARIKRTMWSRRAQEYEAKINSGDPLAIAEVVRDLHRNAGQPDQSFSERQIYEAAMDRLAAELAALDKTDKLTAASKLSEFLKTV